MSTLDEVKELIQAQGEAWLEFKNANSKRFESLEESAKWHEKGLTELALEKDPLSGGKSVERVDDGFGQAFSVKLKDGTQVPVLSKSARLAKTFPRKADEEFSIAGFVRDNVLGLKAASSSALVPVGVSSLVIDDVRAATTVIQAGAGTIIIDGPTNLAKITGDPSVHEHTEAAADISESDITLAAVSLNPKALVAVVPLTMELVSDSPNLDFVLRASLAAAFGSKLDALALATILADANIPTSSAGQDPAIWLKCLEAIGEAMAAKQPIPQSLICNAVDFIGRASQLASTAGSWLGKPPALDGMTEYPTTAIGAGTAIYGGFDLGFAVAMRQGLMLEVVRFGKPLSASHLLIAHMRGAGVVLQPKRLFIQKKTVT